MRRPARQLSAFSSELEKLGAKQHLFSLLPGELIKISGIPYEHLGDGLVRGGTDPAFARALRTGTSEMPKSARALPRGIPLARAAGYGALAGVGMHGGKKLLAAAAGQPDPSEYGETAIGTAGKTAVGGAAIAGLLNLLNRVTAKR